MPIYDVLCESHGRQEVVSKNHLDLTCPVFGCGRKVKRAYSFPPVVRVDFRDGWDAGAGEYFYTKRERENWISMSNSRRVRS